MRKKAFMFMAAAVLILAAVTAGGIFLEPAAMETDFLKRRET